MTFVLELVEKCSYMASFGELPALLLLSRAPIRMLKFWNRIRMLKETTLDNVAYKKNISMNTNWCQNIQDLNAKYSLHRREHEAKSFSSLVKKEIRSDFIRYLESRIGNPDIEKKTY